MINRSNWHLTRAYLAYRVDIDLISKGSAGLEEYWLRHLLEWAKEIPFENAPRIRPAFPTYILTARLDGDTRSLSRGYVMKVIGAARRFFAWLTRHRTGYAKRLTPAWFDTLKPPTMITKPTEHEAVTLEEVQAMAQAPTISMIERRIQAAAVFWFLSGIRVGAFVTLPITAVDLASHAIKQWPSLGVRTKFKKHATTFLLNIPDLLEVVIRWDNEVRAVLPESGFWFAPVITDADEISTTQHRVGEHRTSIARKDLKNWLKRVGLPYHSPHKFRHGHAVYALKHSKDIAQLKAVSQNLMHANLSITDGVYGILSDADVRNQIAALGSVQVGGRNNELIPLLEEVLAKLKK